MSGTAFPTQRVHAVGIECHSAGLPRPKRVSSSRLVPINKSIRPRRTVGHRRQRMVRKQDAVDDRKERKRDHPGIGTSLAHLFGRAPRARRAGPPPAPPGVHEAMPSAGGQSIGRSARLLDGVHVHPAALHDGPPEEALGAGVPSNVATLNPPADSPKMVTLSGSPPKTGDVVAHPTQRGQLVLESPVRREPVGIGQVPMTQEAQSAEAVIDGHDHGVAVAHQLPAPVEEDRAAPRGEAAAVDEDHDRSALPRLRPSVRRQFRRPHVEREAVLAVRFGRDGSDGLVMPGTAADCGAIGPKVDASRISLPTLGVPTGGATATRRRAPGRRECPKTTIDPRARHPRACPERP